MADLWSTASPRGVGAGHVDDRGYRYGAHAGSTAADRARAVRQVASRSKNAGDCRQLLDMLGLSPAEGQVSSERAS